MQSLPSQVRRWKPTSDMRSAGPGELSLGPRSPDSQAKCFSVVFGFPAAPFQGYTSWRGCEPCWARIVMLLVADVG